MIKKIMFDDSYNLVNNYKRSNFFLKHNMITIAKLYRRRGIKKYHCIISPNAFIGENVFFPHPIDIIIGDGVYIGKNAIIYHNVTLGQNNNKYPRIGDNVVIYPGAVIIGDIQIGDNCIIGANAVVNKSFPNNSIIAGVPARVIGKLEN